MPILFTATAMTADPIPKPERASSLAARRLAALALALGAGSAVVALLAGPAYRMERVALATAFLALRWATCVALGSAIAAALAWVVLQASGAARGRAVAAVAVALALLTAAGPLVQYSRAQRLPRIHDISTDTADPPAFVDVLALRQGARNSVDYPPETAAQQRRGYPDIEPLQLKLSPAQAFERAERTARAMGWQIVAARPDALRIEATDTTLMFGFKDDIVIRVRAQAQGSVVDVRSLSRIGSSDIGANADRVRAFLGRLDAV